jgi:hypothetical protein
LGSISAEAEIEQACGNACFISLCPDNQPQRQGFLQRTMNRRNIEASARIVATTSIVIQATFCDLICAEPDTLFIVEAPGMAE